MNDPGPVERDFIHADNPKAIEQFGNAPILGTIPFLPGLASDPRDAASWRAFEEALTGLPAILAAVGARGDA